MPVRKARNIVVAAAATAATVLRLLSGAVPAVATAGDIGHLDQSFTGVTNPPTSAKPQSKLWYVDGFWWADMFDAVSRTWHIFRLDRATGIWVDTKVVNDTRANTLGDVL